jgi:hypothetical protein
MNNKKAPYVSSMANPHLGLAALLLMPEVASIVKA